MVYRLLHRWFVEYNPLYLASATFVLAGLTLLSNALASQGSVAGLIGVGVASEAYAWCLIACTWILMRFRAARPATFLALLVVLYQGDLALTTETNAVLETWGVVASAVWLASFVFKLRVLAAVLRLRVSPSAFWVATSGAAGLAAIPLLSRWLDPRTLSAVFATWLFATATAAVWSRREVVSERTLDDSGQRVLRRALRATWMLWATLGGLHVMCWNYGFHFSPVLGIPVAALVATRWARYESGVIATIVGTLSAVGWLAPSFLPLVALLAAATFVVHATRSTTLPPRAAPEGEAAPYRGSAAEPVEPLPQDFAVAHPARARKLVWAGYAVYLAAWSAGAGFPDHFVLLDTLLASCIVLVVYRTRLWVVLVPLASTLGHAAVRARMIRTPDSMLEWGVASLSLGGALLMIGMFVSIRFATQPAAEPGDTGP